MATIILALKDVEMTQKPSLVTISTTGMSDGPRDCPLLILWLYQWLLAVPHADKHTMERLVRDQADKPGSDSTLNGFTIVRPSFFVGEGKGLDSVKVGTEQEPTIGYWIGRKDVGEWIYETLLKNGMPSLWTNQVATLTY